ALEVRDFPDGLVVDEQLEIVGPRLAGSGAEDTDEDALSFGTKRQDDGVFCPVARAFKLAVLHIVECDHPGFAVFAHPQARVLCDIFEVEEKGEVNGSSGEVDGQRDRKTGEAAGAVRVALDARGPFAAVEYFVIGENRFRWICSPSARGARSLLRFEGEQ